MFKRFHENFVNVIAVSSCNQIYQHALASWFTKVRHQQQKEADYCKNKSFSNSSNCFWNMCKKLLEKTSYPESVVRRCSLKKMFLKISQILQENTCAAISFLQQSACNFVENKALAQLFSSEFCKMLRNTLFTEHFRTTASGYHNNMPRGFKTKCEKNESNDILITYLYILMASLVTQS